MGGRIQNLKPWPKGVSGNRAGRPKDDISVEIARAVFENNAEAIYYGMARRLAKGDARVFKVLADRAYGKVKERVEFEPEHDLSAMSEAELNARIAKLEAKLGVRRYDQSDLTCLTEDELKTLETIHRKITAASTARLALVSG